MRPPGMEAGGAVLQRRPSITEPGGAEGEGFESGLLKMGIEKGGGVLHCLSKQK